MRWFQQLFVIFGNNLKIVFRSWTSLFLLVLGPLLLILLVGYAFGGEGLHDISLGYYAKYPENTHEILQALQDPDIRLQRYYTLADCSKAVQENELHICVEFSDDFKIKKIKEKEASQGVIFFYYDNARFNLIAHLTKLLNQKLSVKTEELTLETTKSILADISSTVGYMQDVRVKLVQFRDNATEVRSQLIQTKSDLEKIQADFQGFYADFKTYSRLARNNAALLDSLFSNVTLTTNATLQNVDALVATINKTNKILAAYLAFTGNDGELKLGNTTLNVTLLQQQMLAIEHDLTIFKAEVAEQQGYVLTTQNISERIISSIDNIAVTLRLLDDFLAASLAQTEQNIDKMNTLLVQVDVLLQQLDENIAKFTGLSQTTAGSILKPISSSFVPLLKELSKINLVFPIILVFVICFIAILLSTMNVLQEISSPAHFRSFLLPVHMFTFLLALFITNIVVVGIQIGVLLIIANIRFDISLWHVLPSFIVIILLFTTVCIIIGMIVGYVMKNKQIAVIISTFIALIMFLFSDVIFPLESMPVFAAFFANLNPLVIAERLFRKLLYYNISLGDQLVDVAVLLLYTFILGLVLLLAYRYHKKKT